LQLLSVGLIELLLLACSPQAIILKSLLWGGGIGILLSCSHVLRWGVALARVPKWRFRRAEGYKRFSQRGQRTSQTQVPIAKLGSPLFAQDADSSEEDKPAKTIHRHSTNDLTPSLEDINVRSDIPMANGSISAIEPPTGSSFSRIEGKVTNGGISTPRRRNTLPIFASIQSRYK